MNGLRVSVCEGVSLLTGAIVRMRGQTVQAVSLGRGSIAGGCSDWLVRRDRVNCDRTNIF